MDNAIAARGFALQRGPALTAVKLLLRVVIGVTSVVARLVVALMLLWPMAAGAGLLRRSPSTPRAVN